MRQPMDKIAEGWALRTSPATNSNASMPRTNQANEGIPSPAKKGLRALPQPTSMPMTAL